MMLALTVRQPWAWAIIHAGKDIENRTWSTAYRGPLAIHAGKMYDRVGELFLSHIGLDLHDVGADMDFGAIIGVVDLIGCTHTMSDSRWAQPGLWHWRLANPRAVQPVFVRGQQGLFTVNDISVGAVMAYINVGDTVRRCDDLQLHGTVLEISDVPRRDMSGMVHEEWSRMVLVEWPKTKHWEPPELLVRVHDG